MVAEEVIGVIRNKSRIQCTITGLKMKGGSGKGVLKREKCPNTRKPSHCRICAELWKHRGQHKREGKKNKQLKITDCEPYGNFPSGEAAQTPAHGISKRGLGREARRRLCPLE